MKVVALNTLRYAKSTPGYVNFTRDLMNYRPAKKFYGIIKSRKCSIFVIDSYLKVSAFTAVKRDAKF